VKIAVFGAGAWGTALAQHAARRHPVLLVARDPAQAADIARERCNRRYLPGVALAESIQVSADPRAACHWLAGESSLAVIATPVAGLAAGLDTLAGQLPSACAGVVWLCKGIEARTARLPH